jgi:FKBP-type peptidyl-prolyl cis-trans isomerase (trigger factor)
MDEDSFTLNYYGTTLDGFIDAYAEEYLKETLAVKVLANMENLNATDRELDETLLKYAVNAGYATVEEYIDISQREGYRENLTFQNVLSYLVENAVVVSP